MNETILYSILENYDLSISRIDPVTTGKFNDTYIIKLNNSSSKIGAEYVVLRIAPASNSGFIFYEKNMMAQEPEIHQIVKEKTSIPIPEIYIYDNSHSIINRDFLIMEYISGKALSESAVDQSLYNQLMELTGQYLHQLHTSCTSDTYGYSGRHHPMEAQKDWQSAFYIMWNKLIDDIEKCRVYDKKEQYIARDAIEKHLSIFIYRHKSSLLHMDIWAQNIIIDKSGTINGIIDWDRALWGDPEIEFAVLDYCGFNNDSFWNGYGSEPEKNRESKIRSIFYHLYEVQKYLIIYTLRRKDFARVQQYKQYSLNLLTQLV